MKSEEKLELIDWFEKQDMGAIINNDFGKWAVSDSGTQNVPEGATDAPFDFVGSFFIGKEDWKDTIYEAIKHYRDVYGEEE